MAETTKTIKQEWRRYAGWGAFVLTIALIVPMLSYLRGGTLPWRPTESAIPGEAPSARPVRDMGFVYTSAPVMTLGFRQWSWSADKDPGMPSMLEVVLPAGEHGIWVIDRPISDEPYVRYRRFKGDKPVAEFTGPSNATLFIADKDGGIWHGSSVDETGRERVRHWSRDGKPLGEYSLPERVYARALTIDGDGGVWAVAEAWMMNKDSSNGMLTTGLIPVAAADGEAVEDAINKRVEGGFYGSDGVLYRVSGAQQLPRDTMPIYTVSSRPKSGKPSTYRLPMGYRPYAADDQGRVYAELIHEGFSEPRADSSLACYDFDNVRVVVADRDGTRSFLNVSRPMYVAGWAPSVQVEPTGTLLAAAVTDAGLAVHRMSPTDMRAVRHEEEAAEPQLTVLAPVEPISTDPYRSMDELHADLMTLVFSGLVSHDASLSPVPDLAVEIPTKANGGVSQDGLTIRYRIRDGVKWHDGRTVSADDVVATWRYLRTPRPYATGKPFPGYDAIRDVVAVDGVVEVRLSKPFGAGPETFFPFVLPAHLMVESPSGLERVEGLVGSGPFEVTRWESGRWLLKAHPDGSRSVPKLRAIEVDFGTLDSAYDKLMRATRPTLMLSVGTKQAATMERDRIATARRWETGRWWGVALNAGGSLRDVETRRGLLAAYPAGRLARLVFPDMDLTEAVDSFPRTSRSHDPSGTAVGARREGGRVRLKKGTPLDVSSTVKYGTDEIPVEQVRELINAWNEAGGTFQPSMSVYRYYASWWTGGYLRYRGYDAAPAVFPSTPDPAWGGIFDPADVPGPTNSFGMAITRADDAQLRRLYEQARSEYDPVKRAAIARRITARVEQLALVATDRYETKVTGIKGRVVGHDPGPYPAGEFWNVETWEIGEAL